LPKDANTRLPSLDQIKNSLTLTLLLLLLLLHLLADENCSVNN
jgi:hypothetical protein